MSTTLSGSEHPSPGLDAGAGKAGDVKPMLSVSGLDLYYGDAQALDGVSLEVAAGSIVAIIGANGAGKTSLIRAIAGIEKPRAGRIVFREIGRAHV